MHVSASMIFVRFSTVTVHLFLSSLLNYPTRWHTVIIPWFEIIKTRIMCILNLILGVQYLFWGGDSRLHALAYLRWSPMKDVYMPNKYLSHLTSYKLDFNILYYLQGYNMVLWSRQKSDFVVSLASMHLITSMDNNDINFLLHPLSIFYYIIANGNS